MANPALAIGPCIPPCAPHATRSWVSAPEKQIVNAPLSKRGIHTAPEPCRLVTRHGSENGYTSSHNISHAAVPFGCGARCMTGR